MSEQQTIEISGRLRELKAGSTETNESIGDAVGVKERTVAGWLSPTNPQAISYENAKKVAELFHVSIEYLWRGEERVRVPADFMERFAALEAEVKELRKEKGAKASAAEVARKSLPKKKSAPAPRKRQRRRGS